MVYEADSEMYFGTFKEIYINSIKIKKYSQVCLCLIDKQDVNLVLLER